MGFEYQALASSKFQMPEGWKVTTIADVACVNEEAITKRNAPEQIEYIDISSVDKGNLLGVQELLFEKAPSRARRVVQSNDSLIATVRPNLEHYLFVKTARPNTIASTGFAVVRAKSVEPRFLYYYLTSKPFTAYLTRIAESHTSTYPAFNPDVIENAELLLPTEPDQRAIACILGTLDDKIEENRRINETLEAMVSALFKSWFIDFDPVIENALAAGKPIPEAFTQRVERLKATPTGLPEALRRKFPDTFRDSDLGPIPAGWSYDHLSQHIDATKGLSYKGAYLCEAADGMALHNLNSIYEGGGYKYEGIKWYSGEYKDRHLVYPGELLVTNTEQGFDFLLIGYAAIVPEHYEEGLFSHHLYRVRTKESTHLTPLFFYHLLRDGRFHRIVAGYTNGTTVNMLPSDGLEKPRFVVPPEDIYPHFDEIAESAQAKAEVIYEENRNLAAIRDALLPKLISGELKITDAERIAGRAL